jgi:hypothetical protein
LILVDGGGKRVVVVGGGNYWSLVGDHVRVREVDDTQDFFVNPIKAKIFL